MRWPLAYPDRRQSYFAGEVFDRIGPLCPELVPAAIDLLRDGGIIDNRATLLRLIARHAPAAKEAIPVMVKILDRVAGWWDPPLELFDALGAFGPAAKDALPRLRELLDHHSLDVVLAARDAIAKIEGKK